MGSPLVDVVQGYASLASSLVEQWSARASKIAAKLDDGTYDADSAAADLAGTASLATESAILLASEVLDAAAILAGRRGAPHVVESDPFTSPLPGAALELTDRLVNVHGSDALPANAVSFEPSQLAPKGTEFSLRADATGHSGGTYLGEVKASDANGVKSESVPVWIIVP